jgi:anthranilate synthase/indole-3-glycerol phosphate synthase/phosphoribosylanthranilate isomerase
MLSSKDDLKIKMLNYVKKRAFAGKVPVLGVCLGHECLVTVYGGEIVHAGEIVHGKTSSITHDGKGVFAGIPNNVNVIRYHSLAGTIDLCFNVFY